jgi:hypothetical protein
MLSGGEIANASKISGAQFVQHFDYVSNWT